MNVTKARLNVYEATQSISESQSLLHSIKTQNETPVIPVPPHIPFQALNTTPPKWYNPCICSTYSYSHKPNLTQSWCTT